MAQFIGFVQGSGGEVSRTGTKQSGLSATARGWEIGGSTEMCHSEEKGDYVEFYIDGGSNNKSKKLLATAYSDGTIHYEGL